MDCVEQVSRVDVGGTAHEVMVMCPIESLAVERRRHHSIVAPQAVDRVAEAVRFRRWVEQTVED